MEARFVDKLPLRITKDDFKRMYLANFPGLKDGHDDIIDNAPLRRGKQTIHETYKEEFNKFNHNENIHNNLSLCIGDIGFFFTNDLIIKK